MRGRHVSDENRYQSVHHIWTDSPEGTPGYLVCWWVGPTLSYHIKPSVTHHPQIRLTELIPIVNNNNNNEEGGE